MPQPAQSITPLPRERQQERKASQADTTCHPRDSSNASHSSRPHSANYPARWTHPPSLSPCSHSGAPNKTARAYPLQSSRVIAKQSSPHSSRQPARAEKASSQEASTPATGSSSGISVSIQQGLTCQSRNYTASARSVQVNPTKFRDALPA